MLRPTILCLFIISLTLLAVRSLLAEELISKMEPNVASEQEAVTDDTGTPGISMQPSLESGCCDPHQTCGDYCGECQCLRCRFENPCCDQNDGFFVRAWLDQGFTGNADSPSDGFNGPLMFNDRSNEYQMNQLYLSLGRAVDTNRFAWDIGGQVDLLYGTDYFFTTAIGLETNRDGTPKWNSSNGPRGSGAALYGLAMPQVYAEVFAPIGNGLTVKMGHFYTILGYESVMAPENFFYSHSYSMQYGEPFTHTGMLATYDVSPCLTFDAGFTRGWDTWEDPNETLGFLGGVTWTSPDDRTSIAFALHTGNEDAAGDNNRTVYSLVLSRQLTQRLTYVFQHDLGVEADAAVIGVDRVDGNWYSINQYLIYQLNCTTSIGLRAEWFRDEHSTRIFTVPAGLVEGRDYSELTLGLNWKPNQHVVLRPEVRWDWSGVNAPSLGVGGMYDDFSKKSQFTIGLDLILLR